MSAATILLVDDDEVLSQVLRRVLTREGYTVVQAGNVAEALRAARSNNPQLALLDLCLPDGDGMELARQLGEQVAVGRLRPLDDVDQLAAQFAPEAHDEVSVRK